MLIQICVSNSLLQSIVGRDGTINDRGSGYMVRKDVEDPRFQETTVLHQDLHSPDCPSTLFKSQQSILKEEGISNEK